MNSKEKERIKSNLEELDGAYNTIQLYSDAISEALELIDNCNEIVHCGECKNHGTGWCPVIGTKENLKDDWYCADGERW